MKTRGEEGRILKKYIKGGILDAEDEAIVKELASTGLIHVGFSIEKNRETAQTTVLGLRAI